MTGDQYARLTSTEAAAHTASYIFYQVGCPIHDKRFVSEHSKHRLAMRNIDLDPSLDQ